MAHKLQKVQFIASGIGYFPSIREDVLHGFSWGKSEGNMAYSFGDKVAVKLRVEEFLKKLKMSDMRQSINMVCEHGDRIVDIDNPLLASLRKTPRGISIKGDAFFTSLAGIPILVRAADCTVAVVTAIDLERVPVVGLVHSGRRGVEKGLPGKSITHLINSYGCDPKSIHLHLPPQLSMEKRRFKDLSDFHNLTIWDGFIKNQGNEYYIDETGCAISQYLDSGVLDENITIYDICTYKAAERGECFSHKYQFEMGENGISVPNGRFAIAVQLVCKE